MDLFDDKADKTAVPTRVSQLTNDAGYITGITTDDLYNHLERGANIALDKIDNKVRISSQGGSGPSEVNWSDIVGKPAAINNIDAELADAKRKPALPSNGFMFRANGSPVGGYNISQSGSTNAGITIQKNGVAIAPTISNNNATYNIDVPTGVTPNDSTISISVAGGTSQTFTLNQASNKSLSFPISYDSLTNKPTIPTVNNATLNIQRNGVTVGTFTANRSSGVTANVKVPTFELDDTVLIITNN